MKNNRYTLRALARLLAYPDAQLRSELSALADAIDQEAALPAARRTELRTLALELQRSAPLDTEARYVETFDRGRATSLLDPLFMLPLATSSVTLGFGYIIALDEPPLNLRTSLLIVPLAHTLVAYPFVVRSILPALRSIPAGLRESAVLLGAAPSQVWWKVTAPLIRMPLVVGAIFAFTVSLGEFGATIFLARPELPTMPLAIYRFLGRPGALNYGQAMAMATVLMLVCAAAIAVLDGLQKYAKSEF